MYFVREDLVEQSFICCTTHAVQQTTGGLAELSAYDMYIAKIYRPRTIFLFFLPLIVWICLHSILQSELSTDLYGVRRCVMVIQGQSRSRNRQQSRARV